MELKLSVIVPIYNVENYLHKCIDSLLQQDLSADEYEIILVDDGSPDRCGEICDEYATKHSNVQVIHRENGGLGAARNSGIDVAQGIFVQFVDSDDYLEPMVLGTLVRKMETDGLDVLRFNYQNVNEQYEIFEPNKTSKPFVDYCDEVCDGLTFLTERLGFGCYACQFMIRRDLLDNNHFKEGVYFEDAEWTPRLLLKAKRVTSTDLMVYNYLMRDGSITKSNDDHKKLKVLSDKLALIDSMKQQMEGVADKRWFEGVVAQTALSVIGFICDNFFEKRRSILRELRAKKVFPLSDFHATARAARKIRMANLSPLLLCDLMYLKNKK